MTAPERGYILHFWNDEDAYRSTALAYMERENVKIIENKNGKKYTYEEIKNSIICGIQKK